MTAKSYSSQTSQMQQELHTQGRKRRRDADQPRWQRRDYYALQWVGEQGAIRFDQLQRLLGRESLEFKDWQAVLSESATRNAIDRWETARLINSDHVMPNEQKYYWLSNAGFEFAGLSLPHCRPKFAEMPFILACNQARLHLEQLSRMDAQEFGDHEYCLWESARERQARFPDRKNIHLPNAGVFRTQARGALAIEVVIESGEDTEGRMRTYAIEMSGFSEIWYLALSEQFPLLEETREKLRLSGVDVSRISLFQADSILIPSSRRKRVKKKGQ
jgi:hypothetical protein